MRTKWLNSMNGLGGGLILEEKAFVRLLFFAKFNDAKFTHQSILIMPITGTPIAYYHTCHRSQCHQVMYSYLDE